MFDKEATIVLTTEQLYNAAGWLEDKAMPSKSMHSVTSSANQDYRASSALSTSLFFDPIDDDDVSKLVTVLVYCFFQANYMVFFSFHSQEDEDDIQSKQIATLIHASLEDQLFPVSTNQQNNAPSQADTLKPETTTTTATGWLINTALI